MNTHVTDLYERGKLEKSWTFYIKNWKDLNEKYIHVSWKKYNKEKRGYTQCHAEDTPTRFKFEQDNQTKIETQQKWKYKKTFKSSGHSCVSNMKLFCLVVAETSCL